VIETVGPTVTRFELIALSCWSSQVDESTLEALTPKLVQLIRSGVGLTTRAGVARFITMLTMVRCRSLHQQSGVLHTLHPLLQPNAAPDALQKVDAVSQSRQGRPASCRLF
jgi:hypothetical protein